MQGGVHGKIYKIVYMGYFSNHYILLSPQELRNYRMAKLQNGSIMCI